MPDRKLPGAGVSWAAILRSSVPSAEDRSAAAGRRTPVPLPREGEDGQQQACRPDHERRSQHRQQGVDGDLAELLAPGHPLHDAVMADAVARHRDALQAGTVLVSRAVTEPTLMVGVAEEITDGTGAYVGRRFGYAYVDQHGTVTDAGPAPYLDCVAAPSSPVVDEAKALPWLADAEQSAVSWMITHRLPDYLAEVQPRRTAELERTRDLVTKRLQAENERLLLEAAVAREKELAATDATCAEQVGYAGRIHEIESTASTTALETRLPDLLAFHKLVEDATTRARTLMSE